jgi:dUTP pyrophosphatase
MIVKIKTLAHFDKEFGLPKYESLGAAGADIRAALGAGQSLVIKPMERVLIPTGLSMEIPQGFEVQIRPRSSMSYKTSLMVLNSPGTIDADYRGEVKIIMGNLGHEDVKIEHGDRIAQMVVASVIQAKWMEVNSLSDTDRGVGGFGSTGKN